MLCLNIILCGPFFRSVDMKEHIAVIFLSFYHFFCVCMHNERRMERNNGRSELGRELTDVRGVGVSHASTATIETKENHQQEQTITTTASNITTPDTEKKAHQQKKQM